MHSSLYLIVIGSYNQIIMNIKIKNAAQNVYTDEGKEDGEA